MKLANLFVYFASVRLFTEYRSIFKITINIACDVVFGRNDMQIENNSTKPIILLYVVRLLPILLSVSHYQTAIMEDMEVTESSILVYV